MKKHIFSFLIMLALLYVPVSCDMLEEPPAGKDTPGEKEKEPPPEKMYYTLRLVDDDSEVIGIGNGSRALTDDLAKASHDFFEVVFYYNGTAASAPPDPRPVVGHRIARATWNIGETPAINGVYGRYKGDPSLNYSDADPSVPYNSVRSPAGGTGSALLFVGTKADKTLLAVGELTSSTLESGAEGGKIITPNTESVTFEVTALRAGARFTAQIANSAFFTSYGAGSASNLPGNVSQGNTTIDDDVFIHYIGKKKFPLYMLNRPAPQGTNNTTRGAYTFNIVSGNFTTKYAGDNGGIILAGGFNCELRNPRYIITDGLYQYSSIFPQDLRLGTAVMSNNIQPINYIDGSYSNIAYFQNPVLFQFVTTNSPDGAIFALVFETMVYNLTPRPTTSDSSLPVKWRISTGAGTKWLDLDDGLDREGGAILLGSGNVQSWLAPYSWMPD